MNTTTTIYPFSTPGVHVQETTPAPGPIQGASTSVAAFVGVTQSGPDVGTVNGVTSYRAFIDLFKNEPDNSLGFQYLACGVYGFFNNGGARCYVTRVSPGEGSDGDSSPPASSRELSQWRKDVVDEVTSWLQGHDAPAPTNAQKKEFSDLLATLGADTPGQLESELRTWLQALNWKQAAKNIAKLVDDVLLPGLIKLLLGLQEALDKVFESAEASAEAAALSSSSIISALELLEPYDDISMVAAPGLTEEDQWSALVSHCAKNAKNCFAILDAPKGAGWENDPPVPKQVLQNPDYAAIYYPWIKIANPGGGEDLTVPPSGHVAGVYARVDTERGVFKAPANESIYGALDLPVYISDKQQKGLNDGKSQNPDNGINVNCIRRLNGGILIWGARTVQDESERFKYVSTRRTFNYIRQSLENGTQWAVFEPNTQALWGQITRNTTSFLTKLWQEGGLFGSTAAEAFYVKCDADTNPESVRNAGQVVTEVGVAITKPAEFVVFHLGLVSGSATPSANG